MPRQASIAILCHTFLASCSTSQPFVANAVEVAFMAECVFTSLASHSAILANILFTFLVVTGHCTFDARRIVAGGAVGSIFCISVPICVITECALNSTFPFFS